MAELIERLAGRDLPWRDRRKVFVDTLARRHELPAGRGERGGAGRCGPG